MKNLSRLNDYMQYSKNKIKIECIWFCKVLKCMDRFVAKLKAIKYKKDSFCNLFS